MINRKHFLNKIILVIILLFFVICAGCSGEPDKTESNQTVSEYQNNDTEAGTLNEEDSNLVAEVFFRVYTETIRDPEDGGILLKLKITVPELKNPDNKSCIAAINKYYEKFLQEYIANILDEGQKSAQSEKKYMLDAGQEFYPYSYESTAEVHYNGNNLFSVLHTIYEDTGGAHPMIFRRSETFNLKNGELMVLNDILGGSMEEALHRVYEIVLNQIEENKDSSDYYYTENYREDLRNYYNENDFYLSGNSIVFYYQLYTLGPYAVGFPEFEIPFADVDQFALQIPSQPDNQSKIEMYHCATELLERNKIIFFEIYGLSMLETDIPEDRSNEEVFFPVIDQRFTTYAELEGFIKSTYVQSVAESLLGNGRYVDVEGKLYADISKDTGGGYYVDWENYSFQIVQNSDTEAELHIFTIEDSPAGKEDIVITVKMLKENSEWLLEDIIS